MYCAMGAKGDREKALKNKQTKSIKKYTHGKNWWYIQVTIIKIEPKW